MGEPHGPTGREQPAAIDARTWTGDRRASSRLLVRLVLIFLALVGGMLAVAAWYVDVQDQALIDDHRQMLESVADLKVRQVASWMRARRADAEILRQNEVLTRHVRAQMEGTGSPEDQASVVAWLVLIQQEQGYSRVVLLSPEGTVLVDLPGGGRPGIRPETLALAREAGRKREIVVSEPRRAGRTGAVVLEIAVPLHAPESGNAAAGLAVLETRPEEAIFREIRDWPSNSETAEAMLVARDGTDVVYLSGTRFDGHGPLDLRVPAAQTPKSPSAIALERPQGIYEGIDYQGVPVLFATRTVPGTSWALVAKIDESEVMAPRRVRLLWTVVVLGLILVATGMALWNFWRRSQAGRIREHLAAAAERAEVSRLYETLGDVNSAIVRTQDRDALLRRICEITVNIGGFGLAWIGMPDVAARRLRPVSWAGEASGYLDGAEFSMDDEPLGRGPSGTAFREGRTVLAADVMRDARMLPWQERLAQHGLTASVAMPLRQRGEVIGVFSLYATGAEAFAPARLDLLERMADEVSYALEALATAAERDRAEEGLRRTNADLEARVRQRTAQMVAVNRELESFAYSVSHDLRAPLRAMDGFAQALEEDCGEGLGEQGRGYLDRIRTASRRMGQLIDDLLRLSRVTRAEMRREPVDLTALGNRVVQELRTLDPNRDVEVDVEPGLEVEGDPNLLWIAMDNLIGNAWKFSSRRLRAHIQVGRRERKNGAEIFVRDDGEGFDPQYAGSLFVPFHRLHSEREFPGSGIGLATVQRIVARHGGRVGAESRPGEGATFWFTLNESRRAGDVDEADPAGGRQPG